MVDHRDDDVVVCYHYHYFVCCSTCRCRHVVYHPLSIQIFVQILLAIFSLYAFVITPITAPSFCLCNLHALLSKNGASLIRSSTQHLSSFNYYSPPYFGYLRGTKYPNNDKNVQIEESHHIHQISFRIFQFFIEHHHGHGILRCHSTTAALKSR